MEAGKMASQLDKNFQIYVLGEPRIFSGFPTLAFIAPDHPRSDLSVGNLATFTLAPGENAAFFAIPENLPLLAEIAQKYPGGVDGIVFRKPHPNEILFEYYILALSD
jgi:hypothetical protein